MRNCKGGFGEFSGMYGAVEVLSKGAVEAFYRGFIRCLQQLPWNTYGEDLFMQKCLDLLSVTHIDDFNLLSDGYCNAVPSPCVHGTVAFHPFKLDVMYEKCWTEATR